MYKLKYEKMNKQAFKHFLIIVKPKAKGPFSSAFDGTLAGGAGESPGSLQGLLLLRTSWLG